MKTKLEELHSNLKDAFELSQIAQKPKNYLRLIFGDFIKKLHESKPIQKIHDELKHEFIELLLPLQKARTATLEEIENVITILHQQNPKPQWLSEILTYIENTKKENLPNSNNLLCSLIPLVKKTAQLILNDYKYNKQSNDSCYTLPYKIDHLVLLKKLIVLDDQSNIVKYIFAPSLQKYEQEFEYFSEQTKFNAYFSLTKLLHDYVLFFDKKNRSMRIKSLPKAVAKELLEQCIDFDQAQESETEAKALLWGVDQEEYKIHAGRAWNSIKQHLSEQIIQKKLKLIYFPTEKNQYRSGFFSDNEDIKEDFSGNSAALFYFMLTLTNSIDPKIILKNKSAKHFIDFNSDTQPIDQLRYAKDTINDKCKKYFKEDMIISNNLGWQINPLYRNLIRISKKHLK